MCSHVCTLCRQRPGSYAGLNFCILKYFWDIFLTCKLGQQRHHHMVTSILLLCFGVIFPPGSACQHINYFGFLCIKWQLIYWPTLIYVDAWVCSVSCCQWLGWKWMTISAEESNECSKARPSLVVAWSKSPQLSPDWWVPWLHNRSWRATPSPHRAHNLSLTL